MLSGRSKEQLNHAMSNAIVRKMKGFRTRQVGEHAKGDQGRWHDVGPIRRDSRDLATGVEIEAAGRMREQPATLLARFVTHQGHAWQCVVLGPQVDREQAAVFLESFRVLRR